MQQRLKGNSENISGSTLTSTCMLSQRNKEYYKSTPLHIAHDWDICRGEPLSHINQISVFHGDYQVAIQRNVFTFLFSNESMVLKYSHGLWIYNTNYFYFNNMVLILYFLMAKIQRFSSQRKCFRQSEVHFVVWAKKIVLRANGLF